MKIKQKETMYCKIKKRKSFTIIDNNLIRDERISANELGMMVWALSHTNDFIIHKISIRKISKLSRRDFDKAWKNLKNYGYITVIQRDNKVITTFHEKSIL